MELELPSLAAPALHLVESTDKTVFSKIGGLPNLPAGVEWPSNNGMAMAFLCQISMAELPPDAPLRQALPEGYLYFFYDSEQGTWGYDPADLGSWKVVYSPVPPPHAVRDAPGSFDADEIYCEKPIAFKPILSLPSEERLEAIPGIEPSEALYEELDELRQSIYAGQPHHQIGGYPDVIQGDIMELKCELVSNGLFCGDASGYSDPRAAALAAGAAEWQLLLQLDTDDETGFMWGDCGLLYFWIRQSDLAKRDFDKCWVILQCH